MKELKKKPLALIIVAVMLAPVWLPLYVIYCIVFFMITAFVQMVVEEILGWQLPTWWPRWETDVF